jgi:hypothetical protein
VLIEKWAMRGFLLYVILRTASATWPHSTWHEVFGVFDWVIGAVALGLLIRGVARARGRVLGGTVYLFSMLFLYAALLWAVHERQFVMILSLTTASALFHAIEYLSLVSWSVHQRHGTVGNRMGVLGYLAPRWGLTLAVFVLILGAGGWVMQQRFAETWLLINVIVAFLHYAYDGLIWRRRPARAAAS